MRSQLKHIHTRRKALKQSIDIAKTFEEWEETCVPSYCHDNLAAAYVSWMRLFAAADLARRCSPALKRVLDFGASVGELGHILSDAGQYDFIEQDDQAAAFLTTNNPDANRQTLEDAPRRKYDAVFAIDSLEHNTNFAELLEKLGELLSPTGVLVLSGPTENGLYRLGRRIAGFKGDYHFTTIYEIEEAASRSLERVSARSVPLGVPLFRITGWKRR